MTETDASDATAVVYDLDGTLVRLAVDWEDVERRLVDLLEREGVDADPLSAWDLLSAAEDAGIGDEADELIASAERDGAAASERLPLADELVEREVPVGVCSLNHEEAVRIALDRHDLSAHVESVVGRGTVPERKPHPRALLAAVEELGVDPKDVLFVGDSKSDEETAERAGTRFEWV
ncbi:HAD-IA family hydrolase [Halorussus gelatinilyticus]|uniref:HAD-IA family hydrolase n=1 Tax=Halorussus gelatinilyticus TaxID=2937524 RepID=A0A8U0IKL2_9EURY|nr:HAD-IA family hydrolase [Halorussus gelatinilyticus]UPW00589.1 HAD-IA family hydrolase [Halorussus gelatinilyticus]